MIDYNSLNTFQKYCHNKVGSDDFVAMMLEIYPGSVSYVEEKFPDFRKCPVGFITDRREVELFNKIQDLIKSSGYKG